MNTDNQTIRPVPRARKLTFQPAANRIVRVLLRTPLVCRIVGARLVTIYAVGLKSGRHLTVPVAYTRLNGQLLIGTPFPWARNLRTGEPVDIRIKGRRRTADVVVATNEERVTADYAVLARDNHQFARFNRVALDDTGEPNPADLHACWAAGARSIRLTPR
jgi:hypothetical protein